MLPLAMKTTITDGAMTASSATLTCATSAPFNSSMVGYNITVAAAGSAGGTLTSTITAYISATQVTLADVAVGTVNAQSVTLYWGGSVTVNTMNYQSVTFESDITGGDSATVQIYLPDGKAAQLAPDVNGVTTGLTVGHPSRTYVGGPAYVVTKVGTDGQASLYADFGARTV